MIKISELIGRKYIKKLKMICDLFNAQQIEIDGKIYLLK